jgi:hypothetical protein
MKRAEPGATPGTEKNESNMTTEKAGTPSHGVSIAEKVSMSGAD